MEAGPHRLGQDARRVPAAIEGLYQPHEAGQPVEGVTRVYLGPLKAPAVDIHTNLEEPLAEIAEVAREPGYEPRPSASLCGPVIPCHGSGS